MSAVNYIFVVKIRVTGQLVTINVPLPYFSLGSNVVVLLMCHKRSVRIFENVCGIHFSLRAISEL